jgi:hypothetical protein
VFTVHLVKSTTISTNLTATQNIQHRSTTPQVSNSSVKSTPNISQIHRQTSSAWRGSSEPVVPLPNAISSRLLASSMPPPSIIPARHTTRSTMPSFHSNIVPALGYKTVHMGYHQDKKEKAKTASSFGMKHGNSSPLRVNIQVTAAHNSMKAGKNKLVEISVSTLPYKTSVFPKYSLRMQP